MSGFVSHLFYEFRAGVRNRALLLMNYLFPLGVYLLLGGLMAKLSPRFVDAMIPAMISVAILSGGLLGLPSPLVASREAGVLRSYRVNGVPASSILAAPALATFVHVAIVSLVVTLTAPILFGAPHVENWAGLVLSFAATAFAVAGLGTLIGVACSSTSSTILWQQLVFLPSMMIGGLMVPAEMLPKALGRVGRLLPTTHAMSAFAGLAQGRETAVSPLFSLGILVVGGAAAFALSLWLFRWDNSPVPRQRSPMLALLAVLPYVIAAGLSR